MLVYLVRIADSRQVVGVFAAGSRQALWEVVDNLLDPGRCEYRAMPAGGVWVRGATEAQWPAGMTEDGEDYVSAADQFPLNGAELDDGWSDASEGEWKSLLSDEAFRVAYNLAAAPG